MERLFQTPAAGFSLCQFGSVIYLPPTFTACTQARLLPTS